MAGRKATTRGFQRTAAVLHERIRRAGESRGFAHSRLLTHWAEIAGADIAAIARPVEISHGRGRLGATLTLLTTGAQAPLLEMQKERLRERVNAVYGYNAVARLRITQTAATGFADGQAVFAPRGADPGGAVPAPDPATLQAAARIATPVADDGLRRALETLARNVLSRSKQQPER